MARILDTKSIYYNDVNLIAQPGAIFSRNDVPKELNRIIVSPMEAVIGEKFAIKANKLGLTICLHRFCDVEKQLKIWKSLNTTQNVFVCVGLNDYDRVEKLYKTGVVNFVVDIANGYIPSLRPAIDNLKSKFKNIENVMVGNIMSAAGYHSLVADAEVNTFVRTGIAGGVACATQDSCGYNRGQITEIMDVKDQKKYIYNQNCKKNFIVADGGIKNAGYGGKAFAAGADYIMMGGYFARAEEAETHVIGDGTYWGGASYKQQQRYGGIKRHSEGKVFKIEDEIKPLETLVDELWGGLSCTVSYSGYKTLSEFIGNGVFEVKQNSLPPVNRY